VAPATFPEAPIDRCGASGEKVRPVAPRDGASVQTHGRGWVKRLVGSTSASAAGSMGIAPRANDQRSFHMGRVRAPCAKLPDGLYPPDSIQTPPWPATCGRRGSKIASVSMSPASWPKIGCSLALCARVS